MYWKSVRRDALTSSLSPISTLAPTVTLLEVVYSLWSL
ncbi:hypothetical protein SAMN05428944_7909 [Streptomyces sp. 1222.5]|nr:hypothetical protein SAMN05428944_7909 [Streptomyces sp. 1222.5]